MELAVRSKNPVPPRECGRVVSDEVHVVEVVMPRTRVEGDEIQRVERNVVTTMDINGFYQTNSHPRPKKNYMITQKQDSNENPVPRIRVSKGCAYSASIPNGA